MTATESEEQADPGGVQAAVDRYRDLAKYVITIFAAVGALLVAGTQLASIGKLSWTDTPARVIAAVLGLAAAVAAVAWVIWLALRVLKPVEMSLDTVRADAKLREAVENRPSLLAGAETLGGLHDIVTDPLLTDEERQLWDQVVKEVVDFAAYRKATKTFEDTWKPMLAAAILGVLGICAFAWGANPPKGETSSSIVVQPTPVLVTFTLTDEGRDTLSDALGAGCVDGEIRALAVGGKEGAPRVATIPERDCEAAQFVLDPDLGVVISDETAPGK